MKSACYKFEITVKRFSDNGMNEEWKAASPLQKGYVELIRGGSNPGPYSKTANEKKTIATEYW